jgi:hypothetical protein
MKKKLFISLLLVCCFAVCLAAISDITGNWTTTMKPGNGTEFSVTYAFKTDGDKFTGSVAFPGDNNFDITDGVIKGDSIHFNVGLNGRKIPNDGKVYADSIALDITMMGKKHHNTLIRAGK